MKEARRKLIATLPLGALTLPSQWGKPIVESVMLPAHGQGTQSCEIRTKFDADFNDPFTNTLTLNTGASIQVSGALAVRFPDGCDGTSPLTFLLEQGSSSTPSFGLGFCSSGNVSLFGPNTTGTQQSSGNLFPGVPNTLTLGPAVVRVVTDDGRSCSQDIQLVPPQ